MESAAPSKSKCVANSPWCGAPGAKTSPGRRGPLGALGDGSEATWKAKN